jgi:hypothetical protein
MSELSVDPSNYDFSDPKEVQRYILTAYAELLNCLHRVELDFAQVTECFIKTDPASAGLDKLIKLDTITYKYISALICLHVYYQQILKLRNIETPNYWPYPHPQKSQ